MNAPWIIVVVLCSIGGKVPCEVKTSEKIFYSKENCEQHAKLNYSPTPDCIQPLTIFYKENEDDKASETNKTQEVLLRTKREHEFILRPIERIGDGATRSGDREGRYFNL